MEEFIASEVFDIEDRDRAIDHIMQAYGQEILQLAFSYVKDKTIAEDLTQDIFMKCYNHLHTYNKKSKFRTWLWSIAINQCKDFLRSWYHKNVTVSDHDFTQQQSKGMGVEDAVIQTNEDANLTAAVMNLPIKYREVIYLFYFEEMQMKEIATVTGQKTNTVKTRLRRAKQLLQEQLGG